MSQVKVKQGVAKAVVILAAVANVAAKLDRPVDVVVTSVSDGTHMHNSRHYFGQAVDIRSKNFPTRDDKMSFLEEVLRRLGEGYEGFLEAEGTPNEHFHFEYDPKAPRKRPATEVY